jgi:hypothetical protein
MITVRLKNISTKSFHHGNTRLCTFSTNTFLASLLFPRHEKQIRAYVKAQNVGHVQWVDICCELHIHTSSRIFHTSRIFLCSYIYYCQVQTFLSAQRLSQVSYFRGLECVCVCVCVICSIYYLSITIYLSIYLSIYRSIYLYELTRRQGASRRHNICTDILRYRCDLNRVIIRRTPHIYMSKDSAGMSSHAAGARLEGSDAAGERLQVYIDTIRR